VIALLGIEATGRLIWRPFVFCIGCALCVAKQWT
jgi:hypothetical protein